MIRPAYATLFLYDREVLICLLCECPSFHPDDIADRYCSWCHTWLAEVPLLYERPDEARAAGHRVQALPPQRPRPSVRRSRTKE